MSTGLVFSYGDYDFRPRPLLSIDSQPLKTPDGSGYGIIHSITLDGDIITTGAAELNSGVLGVFAKIENLKNALNHDGKPLVISCNNEPIISGHPIIESYNFDPVGGDQFTRRAGYTIQMTMPTTILGTGSDVFNSSVHPPFIESCSETWDIQFADERMPFDWTIHGDVYEKFGYRLAVTHNVNVQARIAYIGDMIESIPWQDARDYAIDKLGFDSDCVTLTGVLGLPGTSGYFTQFDSFNNFRQVSTDKTNGSISVTETFIVTPSGTGMLPNNAIETFDISTSQQDGVVTVSVDGEVEGLATISYDGDGGDNDGFVVTGSKYDAASGYFQQVKGRLYNRAKTVYDGIADSCFNRPLNPIIKTKTIGTNVINGVITYSYQFDTTPSGCITGTCLLSQNINIDDQLASDVFAEQAIPGRAAGPILQDINTTTARVRTLSMELVTLPPTSCASVADIYEPLPTGSVNSFINVISGDLNDNYSQVFVSTNSENWNFTLGRYTRTIGFTYNNCTG